MLHAMLQARVIDGPITLRVISRFPHHFQKGLLFSLVQPATTRNGYAVPPYIIVLDDTLTRIKKKHDVQVFNKPSRTLQQHFPSSKDRLTDNKQINQCSLPKICCKDCTWEYVGETHKASSNIANHTWLNDYSINFNGGEIIDGGTYRAEKPQSHGTLQLQIRMRTIIQSLYQNNIQFY